MTDLFEASQAYVAAFNNKDINAVGHFFADSLVLTDPEVTELQPKSAVLEYVGNLFASADDTFSFDAKAIHTGTNMSVIEFELVIGDQCLKGADIIEWDAGKMIAMRAYLYPAG